MSKLERIDYHKLPPEMYRTIAFWGHEDEECLTLTGLDETIEVILDDAHPDMPESVEVAGWVRAVVTPMAILKQAEPLWNVLLSLDAEYGDPNGDIPHKTQPTQALKTAERAFAEAIAAEYTPWICEPRIVVVVSDVADWISKHCPHWAD